MRPHIFIDTNIFLEYFIAHSSMGPDTARLFHLAACGKVRASTSATSMTQVAFILSRLEKSRIVDRDILELLQFVGIVPNTAAMLGQATEEPIDDFDDALQVVSATRAKCTHLITTNKEHFRKVPLCVQEPGEFLATFQGKD